MQAQDIEILEARKEEAIKALRKLCKRAHKTGNTDIKWEQVGAGTKKYSYEVDNGDRKITKWATVPTVIFRITGEAPKYNGYELLMRIEFADAGELFHAMPGAQHEVEKRFYKASTSCEHCKKQRNRSDVYVVRHESGKQMQVGRACLHDFLGLDDPRRIVNRFAFWQSVADFERDDFARGCGWAAEVQELLALTAVSLRVEKHFASRAAVQEGKFKVATSDMVASVYNDYQGKEKRSMEYASNRQEADDILAKDTIAYFASIEEPKSDYERNLKLLLAQPCITNRSHMGLVVSAVPAYQRAMGFKFDKSEAAKLREAAKQVQLQDGRQEIVGTIITTKVHHSEYGETQKMLVQRQDGVRLYGSVPASINAQIGKQVKFYAKVQQKEPGFAFFSRPTKAEVMEVAS